jgi:glycosyltransferase involved in cell wall biosynthesis
LQAVFEALRRNAVPDLASEVIVVDNNSSDQTAAMAQAAGARVVFEPINQISRARNAGGRSAKGDWLLFIDADSWLSPVSLAELLQCARRGRHAGGGCLVGLEGVPADARLAVAIWNLTSRIMRWAAGSFVFCRADAFRDIGGFSNDLFAAEEIQFSMDLKRWAGRHGLKVAVLGKCRHVSSGRKMRLYSRQEVLRHLLRSGLRTQTTIRDPKRLEFFYDGRR